MLPSQKIQMKMSELRSQLHDAGDDSAKGDPIVEALKLAEPEYRAALTEEGQSEVFPLDAEEREFRSLRGAVRIGSYVNAAIEGRGISSGPELEFSQALGIPGDGFPMRLLLPQHEERTAVAGDGEANQLNWIGRVFSSSAAARVGVEFRSVRPGLTSVPAIATGPIGGQRARAEATTDTPITLNVVELRPKANSVYTSVQREDTMRLPGFEAAIIADLRAALIDSTDKAVFIGDSGASGADADIVGLSTHSGVADIALSQANKVLASGVLAAFGGLIDGKGAASMADLNSVLSVGAAQLWTSTIPNAATGANDSISAILRDNGLSWQVRDGISSATAANAFGAFIGLARGLPGSAIAAVWEQGFLTRDASSKSQSRTVSLEMSWLWDFGVARPASFKRIKLGA